MRNFSPPRLVPGALCRIVSHDAILYTLRDDLLYMIGAVMHTDCVLCVAISPDVHFHVLCLVPGPRLGWIAASFLRPW